MVCHYPSSILWSKLLLGGNVMGTLYFYLSLILYKAKMLVMPSFLIKFYIFVLFAWFLRINANENCSAVQCSAVQCKYCGALCYAPKLVECSLFCFKMYFLIVYLSRYTLFIQSTFFTELDIHHIIPVYGIIVQRTLPKLYTF